LEKRDSLKTWLCDSSGDPNIGLADFRVEILRRQALLTTWSSLRNPRFVFTNSGARQVLLGHPNAIEICYYDRRPVVVIFPVTMRLEKSRWPMSE
jgi:hypothetical protein